MVHTEVLHAKMGFTSIQSYACSFAFAQSTLAGQPAKHLRSSLLVTSYMAELQAAIDDANRHLKGTGEPTPLMLLRCLIAKADCQQCKTDNDSKVSALQALEQKISNTTGLDVDSTALESIASLLKLSLRNGNSHVYTAGLLCTLALFTIADEHWHTLKQEGHSTSQFDIIIKNAVNTLALPPGGLITFLGDAKDSARATARAALLQAAKLGVALSTTESRLQPDQQPLAVLDKLIKEQGFASKNAKIREQVSRNLSGMLFVKSGLSDTHALSLTRV